MKVLMDISLAEDNTQAARTFQSEMIFKCLPNLDELPTTQEMLEYSKATRMMKENHRWI